MFFYFFSSMALIIYKLFLTKLLYIFLREAVCFVLVDQYKDKWITHRTNKQIREALF